MKTDMSMKQKQKRIIELLNMNREEFLEAIRLKRDFKKEMSNKELAKYLCETYTD